MTNVKTTGFFIFIFFLSIYSLFSIGHFGGDGYEDYLTAESIVLDGNITLNDRPGDTDDLQYRERIGVTGKDGNIYSARGSLGVPVLLSLLYLKGHIVSPIFKQVPHDYITMLFCSFYNPIVLAISVLIVFLVSLRLDFKPSTAAALSFIYGLATMIPVYARTAFAEPTLALFLLLSAYCLVSYAQSPKIRYLICGALALLYSVFTKGGGIVFIPCFMFYLSWVCFSRKKIERKDVKDAVIFFIILLLGVLPIFLYNQSIYGKWFSFGHYDSLKGASRIMASPHFLKGLYYYLLSTGKGFFFYNLPLLLSFFAVGWGIKKCKKETILFLLIFIVNVLIYAKSFRRGSLFSWGPRYLLPSVPFLVILLGFYMESIRGFLKKTPLILFSIAGFFIILPCMFINQSKFYFFVKEKLLLDEYLINFIPDLSPIMGAWRLFLSGIYEKFGVINTFLYDPDYWLFKPIESGMSGYNNFDFWFLKIMEYSNSAACRLMAHVILTVFTILCFVSLFMIFKTLAKRKEAGHASHN